MKSHAHWRRYLATAEFAHNSATNRAIGCSPFEMNKGFQPRTIEDLVTIDSRKNGSGKQWLTKLQQYLQNAKREIENAHQKNKKYYDEKVKPMTDDNNNITFAPVGSMVYLATKDYQELSTIARETPSAELDETMKRKFLPIYIGPFKVLEVCGHGDLNRKIELSPTLQETAKTNIFHVTKLKMAFKREQTEFDTETDNPPPTKDIDGIEEFYVKDIIAHEERRNGRYFRVKLEGYEETHDTWEHESNLEHAQSKITEYMSNFPRPVNPNKRQRQALKQRKKDENVIEPIEPTRKSRRIENRKPIPILAQYQTMVMEG